MPYKSKLQAKAMHAKANEGEISKATVKEFDKKTDFSKLPEKAPAKKGAGPMHVALPHACCGKPSALHKGAGPEKSFVKQILGKQMAKNNATMLANMGAKKRAGY
jgi:hypothetical protein